MPQAVNQFSGIFISYRRDDSAGHTGRLFDRLAEHFGEDQLFMDIDHIEPGEDFVQVIEDAVGSCEILLAVIGRQWLLSTGGAGRRLDNPNDFVRLELGAALQRNIRVIPVLVQGATMPAPRDLPDELAPLTRRQAIELSDQRWRHDIDRLMATLEKVLAERAGARRKLAQEEEGRRRLAQEEEEERQRLAAEEQHRQQAEAQQKREAEDSRKRDGAAALAAVASAVSEQRQRAVTARREAEESERKRLETERQARDRAAVAKPAALPTKQRLFDDWHRLAVAATCIVLAGVGTVVWLMATGGGQVTNVNGNSQLADAWKALGGNKGQGSNSGVPEGMVYVPGGDFTIGRNDGTAYERPAHTVELEPFFIDALEVTCGDYEKFVKEKGHKAPPGWKDGACPPGASRKPVTGVNWHDADGFCRARGKRLPTEVQWETAARGPDGWRYPWGNDWRVGAANAGRVSNDVVEVGSYPDGASRFGALDMVGNAWEWTEDDMKAYPGGKLPARASAGRKVIRGCFYGCDKDHATATYRQGWSPAAADDYRKTGFRCAKDAAR